MDGGADKAREEFFSEAQEIIEVLSRDLLALEASLTSNALDPSLVNDAFRAVHTLKGLGGLFGAHRIRDLSHELESLLDALRLGRVELTAEILDWLFRAVEAYVRILGVERGLLRDPLADLDDLVATLASKAKRSTEPPQPLVSCEIDPSVLAVLTEYEEHRLKSSLEQGLRLYRLRLVLNLMTIDEELDSLKANAKNVGEIITYLPTGQGTDADSIELDVLMVSSEPLSAVREAVALPDVDLQELPTRHATLVPARAERGLSLAEASSLAPIDSPQEGALGLDAPKPEMIASPGAVSLRSVAQTVRVDIRKLDRLMNIVGELSIVRNALANLGERLREAPSLRELRVELHRLHRSFDRNLAEMQDGILEVRMVPLGQLFEKLSRIVRQISRDSGKEVSLVITGGETEVDKIIVEELSDPLMHMMRNAIDHGIEARERRAEAGKPEVGTIALNAFQKGSHVVIEIEDDGSGIDEGRLLKRAIERGLIDGAHASELGRREILNLIFVPGLSTRDEASELSGRGVGMDVVKTNIAKIGGIIDVHSELSIGTRVAITLPITLAILSALVVKVRGRTFAIPISSVHEAIALEPTATKRVEGREVMSLRGRTLPLCRLEETFGFVSPQHKSRARQFVVVAGMGAHRLGLIVDELVGQQDIVIKPLGRSLRKVRGFAGATELGDQRVALVIDATALIEEFAGAPDSARGRALAHG